MNYDFNDISAQVERYFSALHSHPEGLKGGVFTHMEKNKFKEQKSCGYKKSVDNIIKLLTKQDRPVFVTLNSYKKDLPTDIYCKRDEKHLWGLDTIMIDIDAPTDLLGVEDELMDILKWAWDTKRIPKPNLYSYTGSGGVHLYYCFERMPKTMNQSINALKWAIAEKLVEYEKDFPVRNGKTYKVDTKIFDSQRLDRVPGSIHETTGQMCRCFETGTKRYKYKELLEYCDEENWNGKYKIANARNYISKVRGEVEVSEPNSETESKKKEAILPPTHLSSATLTKEDKKLSTKRINGLFTLARKGKDFTGCREISCFILRNWCNQLQYSNNKTENILKKFNNLFEEPLSERELLQNTRSKKLYKFTNAYLKQTLNLTEEEALVFCKRYRPGDRKERTLIDKINIAKLLLQGLTSDQICEKLSISLSLLKRRRAEMKQAEGLQYWAAMRLEKAEKTLVAIVRQLKDKIGEQTIAFRTFIEDIKNISSDIYKMCKQKCSVLLEMLIGHIEDNDLSVGYG